MHGVVDVGEIARLRAVAENDGRTAGGVYLWESRAAAEKVYSAEWRERVAKLYGNAPQVVYFDTPVIVDNLAGGTITKAA